MKEMPNQYKDLYLRPVETRELFKKLGWSKVSAFQTRNPMHRSHEHLVKIAIEITDGVFIHQVLGKLKRGDIPADTRTAAIAAMIDNYFVPELHCKVDIQLRCATLGRGRHFFMH